MPTTNSPADARMDAHRASQGRARAARRAEEVASAQVWLLAAAAKYPDARVNAPDLYEAAVAAIRPRVAEHDPRLGTGLSWRIPGRRVFYSVADLILGDRGKSGSARYFVLRDYFARRLALLRSGDRVGALRLQRALHYGA